MNFLLDGPFRLKPRSSAGHVKLLPNKNAIVRRSREKVGLDLLVKSSIYLFKLALDFIMFWPAPEIKMNLFFLCRHVSVCRSAPNKVFYHGSWRGAFGFGRRSSAAFLSAREISTDTEPRTENIASVEDLAPLNYYEAQILSALPNWKGERIMDCKFDPVKHSEALEELIVMQNEWYAYNTYDHDFFSKKTKDLKQYRQPSTVFETDFYFKTSQPVANCAELFNGCVLNYPISNSTTAPNKHKNMVENFYLFSSALSQRTVSLHERNVQNTTAASS